MLIKWIVCTVSRENREAFSQAQEKWMKLKHIPGFLGQVGGWNISQPGEACILSLWRDEAVYRHFMNQIHDVIFHSSGQQDTYETIQVRLYERLFDIPGGVSHLQGALDKGTLIRMADPLIYRERIPHFVDTQKKIWNPGMAEAEGMLAGVFGVEKENERRFLVATLWKDEASHMAYVQNMFPTLNVRAQVGEDIEEIAGKMVRLIPTWTVIGQH
ncbi:MAG: YdbC family protein [Bacillaceae bacterium]|nr:YdbC family protein [Bacillaceae bacterium]